MPILAVGPLAAAIVMAAQSAPAPPSWPPLTFTPPNVERTDPALARLRDRLLAAIRERSVARVRALMAPTIRDQDTDVPQAEVLANFGPLVPGTPLSDEWLALEQALRLGGVKRDSLYVVPFIEREAPRWKPIIPRLFIAGRDVPVRATADPDGAVVTRVSHALVQEVVGTPPTAGAPGSACAEWTPMLAPERQLAWVCTADTRPVSGLYYAFARVGGAWKLTRIYSIPE